MLSVLGTIDLGRVSVLGRGRSKTEKQDWISQGRLLPTYGGKTFVTALEETNFFALQYTLDRKQFGRPLCF